MTPQETAASYDRIASHWDGPEFNRKNGISQHERALQFAARGGLALDLGCGSSGRIIDLLLSRKFEVEGLDISAEMIQRAKHRHPEVRFYFADICEWIFPKNYDFVSAWDSIWHVPLQRQSAILTKICHALSPGGVFIFTTGGVDLAGEKTNPCLGQPLYHAALGLGEVIRVLRAAGCSCRHLEYDQYPEPHVYIIAQKTA